MNRLSEAKAKNQKIMDDKLVGKTFNKIKIISFSHSYKSRKFYKVLCLNCNSESIMRSDRFSGLNILKTCSNCRQKEAAKLGKLKSNKSTFENILFNKYKEEATKRNLSFNLDKEYFLKLISNNCYYCNVEPSYSIWAQKISRGNYSFYHNGIDRLNNKDGYTIENCVPCCTCCNMMKKTMDVIDFINKAKQITDFWQSSTTISKESTPQANGGGKGENPEMDCDIV